MKKWILRQKKANINQMSKVLNISETLAQSLVNRDINTKRKVDNFTNVNISKFHNFLIAKDLEKGLEIVKTSIVNKEKIVIYGDYDIDGVSSTTILYKGLKYLNANVSYYIPNRESEGYGLNINAINNLFTQKTDLIVTCDNGIASLEEIDLIKSLNMKIVVIDHHQPVIVNNEEVLPKADALIDPKRSDCLYPFKEMCAGGLSFRFVDCLYKSMNIDFVLYEELFVFASIATFGDIVDLKEDNRIFAKIGLEILNKNMAINKGLHALILEKNLDKKVLSSYDIGFIIGPCINATGRLYEATMAVDLFVSDDYDKCKDLAKKLSLLNDERKNLTTMSVDRALNNLTKIDNVIVIYDDIIHESIAGIVAGRIKDKFYHPTIVLTKGHEMAKGSARSIESYNIFLEMSKCKHLFSKFGGHAMAAGVSLPYENIDKFREEINNNCILNNSDFIETIYIDKALNLENVTYTLAKELEVLAPFGKGNKKPMFGSKNLKVKYLKIFEKSETVKFTFSINDYRSIDAIYFKGLDNLKDVISNDFSEYQCEKILKGLISNIDLIVDIVYYIDINNYNNESKVQLVINDFRLSQI